MQFDLFTFLASLFNFLVLMILLRIFLFKRVTKAMDEREKRISDTWDEAEQARDEANETQKEYEDQLQEADEERESLVEAAREEADRERSKQLEKIRSELDEKRNAWIEDLEQDKQELSRRITEQTAKATASAVEQTLRMLSSSSLSNEIAATLARRIRGEWADELGEQPSGLDVTVWSSHELDQDSRERIEGALGETISAEKVTFNQDDSLVCGVRVELADQELGFSVADQVRKIGRQVDELLEETAGASNG